jgi:molybdopterin synthase catalytic subunit
MKLTESKLAILEIKIQRSDFDVNVELKRLTQKSNRVGAVIAFLGLVRDLSKNKNLKFMDLEHYPEMSEKALKAICLQAASRWHLDGVSIIHRVGRLKPGENIVLVLTSSAHRRDAFNASEFIMDFLKSQAPFWKKETTITGSNWVNENSSDQQKLTRWQ